MSEWVNAGEGVCPLMLLFYLSMHSLIRSFTHSPIKNASLFL